MIGKGFKWNVGALKDAQTWSHTIHLEWRAPKFLVRPKKGPTMLKSESSWNLVPLPTSNTERG
jgi:hypothetical protein